MADYAADRADVPTGTTVTERSGTGAADTVPAGAIILWRNTSGANTYTITLTTSNTADGLAIADQTISLPTTGVKACRVLSQWGDVNGRVAVGLAGTPGNTPSEVKFYVLGNV
jgi:hypothetical protein